MKFNDLVDSYKQDIVKSTQDLIKIKSVEEEAKKDMPFGEGPYKALKYVLDLSKDMGFKTKNLDGYVGYVEFGEGEETVGVLAHLDVVPAGDGWTYPPYEAEIHDGKIYGRGSVDDKGPAVATLYAMKALKESNVHLNRKVRLILGTNEETNWGCMKHYFKHEEAPNMAFTPDANFPVIYGEKGIISLELIGKGADALCDDIKIKELQGGTAVNMVPDYCEVVLEVKDIDLVEKKLESFKEETGYNISLEKKENNIKIKSKGISAHGSNPRKGQNAITQLMLFLGELIEGEGDIQTFIKFYNEKIALKHNGEGLGCDLEDEISGKLSMNPGVIKKDGDNIVLSVDARYPIKFNSQDVYNSIKKEIEGTGIELIEGSGEKKPLYVSKDSFLVQNLMQVYKDVTEDKDSTPITIGGGTYARAMDNAVAFGPILPGQEELAHQKDEYIEIDHLMLLAKIYANALYKLAK